MTDLQSVSFTAQRFIDDPSLYGKVEAAWLAKDWYTLFGEYPLGAVLATVGDGITFYYKRPNTTPPRGLA